MPETHPVINARRADAAKVLQEAWRLIDQVQTLVSRAAWLLADDADGLPTGFDWLSNMLHGYLPVLRALRTELFRSQKACKPKGGTPNG